MPLPSFSRLPVLPVLLGTLLGLLAAIGLQYHVRGQLAGEMRRQLAEAWMTGQQSVLDQGLLRISHMLRESSINPEVVAALRTPERLMLPTVSRLRDYHSSLVDARLFARGNIQLDEGSVVPVNYAVQDLLRRAESGSQPAIEAYLVGSRWLLYGAVPVLDAGRVLGTLLLVQELEQLLHQLPPLPEKVGELQLLQSFGNDSVQILLQRGTGSGDVMRWSTSHPAWQLQLRPGEALMLPGVSYGALLGSVLLVLAGSLLGLMLGGWLRERAGTDEGITPAEARRRERKMPLIAEVAPSSAFVAARAAHASQGSTQDVFDTDESSASKK